MFNDQQDNQAQTNTDIDQVAKDISDNPTVAPTLSLGTNPTTFTPVLPQQPTSTPLPPDDNTTTPSDDATSSTDDTSASPTPTIITPPSTPADLDGIKNQALEQLSPLVGKLEQSPEERFKTTMMLIQATDNHELIKEAYEAANKIEDEKLKAEALLAVVNEINYFTQQQSKA